MKTLPDLTVKKFEAQRVFPLPGESVHFDAEIKNEGEAPADSVELSFGRGRRRRERFTLEESLAPAASIKLVLGPVSGNFGNYTYSLQLDPDNEIAESNERNNSAEASFYVIDPRPPVPPPRPPRP